MLHAELGKTTEAREFHLRSMEVRDMNEPTLGDYCVMARIAEQLGQTQVAETAYRKACSMEDPSAGTAHAIARRRLKTLGKDE